MKSKKIHLAIDLTWSENMNSGRPSISGATLKSFKVSFYRMCKQNVHEIKIDDVELLKKWLDTYKIPYEMDRFNNFIQISMESELYIHSECLELRVKSWDVKS